MNYSTFKKTVALSFVSLMAVGLANAQTAATDTSKMMAPATGPAKVFGGASQYSAFSIGINAGVTSGQVAFFNNTTNGYQANLGYGADLRYQVSHDFSIQLEYYGGKVGGIDNYTTKDPGPQLDETGTPYQGTKFKTMFNSVSLGGMFDIGSISFLHRQNGILLYGTAGAGVNFYNPTFTDLAGNNQTYTTSSGGKKYVKELDAPVGAGLKFKLSDALALNIGYTLTFVNGYNFSGFHSYPMIDHYAYTYAGLEYTFGTKHKPNIEWVNPVAMMYDELYDAALRQEVEALKGRVTNVENAVSDLKKDSDGDGVADQFDKCPNTPAGTVVDGSGCPLVIPAAVDTSLFVKKADLANMNGMGMSKQMMGAYSAIQFEFDSSVLKTSSYPALDATSADLKSSGKVCELAGYASSEGTAAHNMRLSKDRANSVKTYLVNSGVAPRKLKVKAFGETHPVADNSTEAGRILNRRVEFHKK